MKSRENYLKPRVSDFLLALMIAAAAVLLGALLVLRKKGEMKSKAV